MKAWLLVLALVLLIFGGSRAVLAHTDAHDGQMHALLHIEPGDDYIVAGRPQKLLFLYDDLAGKFNDQKCNCVLTISRDGQTISSTNVPPQSNYYGMVSYTFAKTGDYSLRLTGKPTLGGAFRPFNLVYNLSVHQYPQGYTPPTNWFLQTLIIAGAVATIILVIYLCYWGYRRI